MASSATINVRMPEVLKRHASQVLEKSGVSTTQAVIRLFEYIQDNQALPEWMSASRLDNQTAKRRETLRALAANQSVSAELDAKAAFRDHLDSRYGKDLP